MELSGQIKTTCPPGHFVRIMRDPAALAQLLPTGSKIDLTAEGSYSFSVSKSVGPIKLTLPGTLTLHPTGQGNDHSLTLHAAHLIGGKVDMSLALTFTTEGRLTQLSYVGDLSASGLAGRVLNEHRTRANSSLKAALLRLKSHAEAKMPKPAGNAARS